ncbi:SDR family oxidoreductase [Glycomyces albidus]|uniref:SDR family NAD(P)-dependent oxidoreductase n=1 Tax=Glycomyces albidus TaxID=2656774 RepID=A0A6L5G3G4_9ACTN|nr:SDR family oxidoreductase [Glycomyces albidus]MQM24185.1 SDR family NAD(P)-dependent oxidoreductase [Glycomyces albidus]
MNTDLTQPTQQAGHALVTGANKGLGFETARRLGELGYTVFLGSRDEQRGKEAAAALADSGSDIVVVPLDVASDESVAEALRIVGERTDRLDVLVNNAGAPGHMVHPGQATPEELHGVYDVNVYGPVRVTNAFLPLLEAADNPRVVMVSSGIGSFTVTAGDEYRLPLHEFAYSSSKAALNMITVRYAQAYPGIKFNAITPGEVANGKFAATDMNQHRGQLTAAEGSDPIVERATLGADGPTGTFIDRLGPVGW